MLAMAALAGALVGGVVAGVVAAVSTSGNGDSPTSLSPGRGSVATAVVVRTNLSNSVQVGGSIGYAGSYTVAAPSGTSAQQVALAQQAVTEDRQALSADQTAESDAANADGKAISADQANVRTDRSTLSSDRAKKRRQCAGKGESVAACGQDTQTLSQDQGQLTQAEQQLTTAQTMRTSDQGQNQAKVATDQTKLQGDQATLSSLETTATSPGTTYTWLPNVGAIIRQDRPVYAVSNVAVPLLYGSVAAYRAFYVGMSNGADIGELTRDLISLGYGAGLTQSDRYSTATAAAVKGWQRALGLPATGEILLGQVVFEPGPIRVTSVTPTVGSSVGGGGGSTGGGGGTILTATGTTPIVTVNLDVSDEYLVKPGNRVSVVLPSGTSTVGGRITTVGNVAACPSGGGVGSGSGSAGAANQSTCSSGGGGGSSPTVTVTITLNRTPPGARLDQAPVNVNITTQRVNHVLAVPVNALLALQGGGFGVDVVTGKTSHLVGVTTGLYSNTLVQVSGTGITTGTHIEVPSS